MKLVNKLVQLVLMISFLVLIYAISLVGVFSSNQKLTKVLDQSGFYEVSSKLMSDELNKQVNSGNSLLNEAIKNSISSTLNSEVAKSVIAPAQIVLVDWLNNNQQNVSIDLDLLPIKNKVGAKTTDSQVKFEITRLLPDNFLILAESKDENGILPQLIRIKELYLFAKSSIPILWIVLLSSALLLFILNLTAGSKKITRILFPILIGSVLGVLISLGSNFASSNIALDLDFKTGVDNFQLLSKFVFTIIRETFSTYSVIAGLSFVGIFISKMIFRSKDKHLRKKHK